MSDDYQLGDKSPFGLGIIVVNGFENVVGQTRTGVKAEIKLMERIFEFLGLEIFVHRNLTKSEFKSEMVKIKEKIKETHSMIALSISSHGADGRIEFIPEGEKLILEKMEEGITTQSTDGPVAGPDKNNYIKDVEIRDTFSIPKLKGKPKLFIFNSCRSKVEADAMAADGMKNKADRFILFSTLPSEVANKAEYKDWGDVPRFYLHLYEVLRTSFNDDLKIENLAKRINFSMLDDEVLKQESRLKSVSQLCCLSSEGPTKTLKLVRRCHLQPIDTFLDQEHPYQRRCSISRISLSVEESDSGYEVPEGESLKKIQVPDLNSVTSLVFNEDVKCFYLADPKMNKIQIVSTNSKINREFNFEEIGLQLHAPRFLEYFPKEKSLVISHEKGIEIFIIDENNNPKSNDSVKDESFMSPCITGDKDKGLLYILSRIGKEDCETRKICICHVKYKEIIDSKTVNFQKKIPAFYSPIITDIKFSIFDGDGAIIILVYLPTPHLFICYIESGNSELISIGGGCTDPAFLTILGSSIFLSCPSSSKVSEKNLYSTSQNPFNISYPNALTCDSDRNLVVSSFNDNTCELCCFKTQARK